MKPKRAFKKICEVVLQKIYYFHILFSGYSSFVSSFAAEMITVAILIIYLYFSVNGISQLKVDLDGKMLIPAESISNEGTRIITKVVRKILILLYILHFLTNRCGLTNSSRGECFQASQSVAYSVKLLIFKSTYSLIFFLFLLFLHFALAFSVSLSPLTMAKLFLWRGWKMDL